MEGIFLTKTFNLHTYKVIKFKSFADVPYNYVFVIESSRNRRWFRTQRTSNASIFHHLPCKSSELRVRAYKSKSESKRIQVDENENEIGWHGKAKVIWKIGNLTAKRNRGKCVVLCVQCTLHRSIHFNFNFTYHVRTAVLVKIGYSDYADGVWVSECVRICVCLLNWWDLEGVSRHCVYHHK